MGNWGWLTPHRKTDEDKQSSHDLSQFNPGWVQRRTDDRKGKLLPDIKGGIWCDTTNTHHWMLYVGATRKLLVIWISVISFMSNVFTELTQSTSLTQSGLLFRRGSIPIPTSSTIQTAFTKEIWFPSERFCVTGRTETSDGLLPW